VLTLDFKTVVIVCIALNALSTIVLVTLWARVRTRRLAVGLWVVDFAFQTISMALIVLRGEIPDAMSIILANALVISGTLSLYMGVQLYLGHRTRQYFNAVYLVVFVMVHAYFTAVHPSLAARNINLSLAILFFAIQFIWYTRFVVDKRNWLAVRPTTIVFLAFGALSALRIVAEVYVAEPANIFKGGPFESSIVLGYGLLLVALAFALLLMVDQLDLSSLTEEIAERSAAEANAREGAEMLRAVFDAVPDAIGITRLSDGVILDVNRGWTEAIGHAREDVLGSTALDIGLWAEPERRKDYLDDLGSDGGVRAFSAQLRRKDGSVFDASIYGGELQFGAQKTMLTVFHDETEAKLAAERLKELSDSDALTGILNVRAFRELASERLRSTERGYGTLYFMDLDGLKRINDGFGHMVGDRMLVSYAQLLRRVFRTSDVIGRMGGDEFAVLAISREPGAEAPTIERFEQAIAEVNDSGELPVPMAVSVGHVSWVVSAEPVDLEAVIRLADKHMYEMKAQHRAETASLQRFESVDNPH